MGLRTKLQAPVIKLNCFDNGLSSFVFKSLVYLRICDKMLFFFFFFFNESTDNSTEESLA